MLKEVIGKQLSKINKEVDIYTQLQSFDTFDIKTQLGLIASSSLKEDRLFLIDWAKNLLINKDYKEIEATWNDIKITYENAILRIPTHGVSMTFVINTKKPISVWKPCIPSNTGYREEMTKLLEEKKNIKTFRKLNAIRKKYNRVTFSDFWGNPIFHTKEKKLQYLEEQLESFKDLLRQEKLRYEKMEQDIAENEQIEKDRMKFLEVMEKDFKNWADNNLKVVVQDTLK